MRPPLPQLRAAYDDDPADLYLYDIGAYAGRALAEAQGRHLLQVDTADATAETLRAALLDLVTDPERVALSARLRAAARAEDGTARAVEVVEEIAGRSTLTS